MDTTDAVFAERFSNLLCGRTHDHGLNYGKAAEMGSFGPKSMVKEAVRAFMDKGKSQREVHDIAEDDAVADKAQDKL